MRRARLLAGCVVAVAAVALLYVANRDRAPAGHDPRITDPARARAAPSASIPVPPSGMPPAATGAIPSGDPAGTTIPPTLDGPRSSGPAPDGAAPQRVAALPVYLDRQMVRDLMTDRVALSAALEPVEKTVEGYRMLRVARTAPGDLHGLLGLEKGDVIVMVNEQSVHEGDNPLWDLLDREGEVRIWVMRDGRTPRHFTYRFE
jgi:hypothetical protein